jgi:hypothetical protein
MTASFWTWALYGTVWSALFSFGLGETARRPYVATRVAARRAFAAHTAGLALMAAHIALAMGVVHRWSHAAAVAATAEQSDAVYGVAVGGGVFVNYLFVAVWAADAWWWRVNPDRPRLDPMSLRLLRVFYLVVLVNAAIVFAVGWRQAIGALFVGWLLWAWRGAPFRG